MTAVVAEAATSSGAGVIAGFEVGYVTEDGVDVRAGLSEVWSVEFERCLPVRRFRPHKGQRHLSGSWWSATTGGHVGYESWLERDFLMLLDHDPSVVGIVSQPLWLYWVDAEGRSVSHAPDFFAGYADGSAELIDCRAVERRRPSDVAKFEATAQACADLGWRYRLVGAVDLVLTANVRWLASYRHPRYRAEPVAAELLDACSGPFPLMAAAESVGDPIAVLPVLFHLLWTQELTVELAVPLHANRVVQVAGGVR